MTDPQHEVQDGQPEGAEVHADEDRVALANDLANRFAFHPANTESRRNAHEQVRAECHALAAALADLVPPGRERSLAWTAVEEAGMWANAGIARQYKAGSEPVAARRGLTSTEQQNPAHLVETQDMPQAEQPGPREPAAPARNVTEQAEAPHRPADTPEGADSAAGFLGVAMVTTTTGGVIGMTEQQAATQPFPGARWDVNADTWEATPEGGAGQPDTALSDPDTPSSP